MRVNDGSLAGTTGESGRAEETQRTDRAAGARTGGSGAAGTTDRVELSDALGSLSRALSSYGSGRAARVEQLAAQYRSGQYQADALATSRGLVAEALGSGNE